MLVPSHLVLGFTLSMCGLGHPPCNWQPIVELESSVGMKACNYDLAARAQTIAAREDPSGFSKYAYECRKLSDKEFSKYNIKDDLPSDVTRPAGLAIHGGG